MVQEPGVNLRWSLVAATHDKDFGGGRTGGLGLGGVHACKELPEGIEQSRVVAGPEDFGDKGTLWAEVVTCQAQRIEHKRRLHAWTGGEPTGHRRGLMGEEWYGL